MSDIVIHDIGALPPDTDPRVLATLPPGNCLPNLGVYRATLRELGFRHVRVEDSTELSVIPLTLYRLRRIEREFDERPDASSLKETLEPYQYWRSAWTWCMAYAIK